MNAPVRPGELPKVTWSLHNDCSDLGSVTANVKFNGTMIYTSPSIAVGLQTSVGAQAMDPPVPDFRYTESVQVAIPPPLFTQDGEAEARPSIAALRAVLETLFRIRAAYEAMGKIHQKTLGAYIDGATDSLRSQVESYREAEQMLLRAAELFPDATAVAIQALLADEVFTPDRIREMVEVWRREGLPDDLRETWNQAGLPKDAYVEIEDAARRVETLPVELAPLLRELSGAIVQFAREVELETEAILALGG